LANALAGTVDGKLEAWGRVEHGRGEHGDADGFSEPAKKEKKIIKSASVFEFAEINGAC